MDGLQAIGVLIIRLWAVGAILGSTAAFVSLAGYNLDDLNNRRFFLYSAVDSAVWFLLGVTAWCLPRRLFKIAVPDKTEGNMVISIGATEFVMIGSFLIGASYLVEYLPNFVALLSRVIYQIGSNASYGSIKIDPLTLQSLIGDLLILVIALVLTFRPREIATMFAALRVAGLSKVDEN